MSGTILKFLKDQHNVYTVYQTSGNIAVFDHDALRMNDFVKEFNIHLGGKNLEVAA
jgi:glucosamine-6-phosphate deaminase